MQADIFLQWMKHFIQHTAASKDNPVLLLLDGHATHVKNLAVIDLARQNGVIMIASPLIAPTGYRLWMLVSWVP